jgi:hypothetical protein
MAQFRDLPQRPGRRALGKSIGLRVENQRLRTRVGELVALDSCGITGGLFFVTMPRRSAAMLSDNRNEREEVVV